MNKGIIFSYTQKAYEIFKRAAELIYFFISGLLLCGIAHTFPSGLNFLASIVGGLLIGYISVKSYEIMKKEKNENEKEKETEQTEE